MEYLDFELKMLIEKMNLYSKLAHRLSTIRDADCIMVIGDGKILESGNHQNLMEKKGKYYKMVISQMGELP